MAKRFQKAFIREFSEAKRLARIELLCKSLPVHASIAEWLVDHSILDPSGKLSPGAALASPVLEQTLRAVEQVFLVSRHALVGRGRAKQFTTPRHVAMMIANLRGLSYSELGQAMARDHTSVRYASIKIVNKIATDLDLRRRLLQAIQILGIPEEQLIIYENMMKA